MPKLKNKLPNYRLHKASGQAVVTLNGRDVYLGRHNSPESQAEYKRAVQEWLANPTHRQLRSEVTPPVRSDLTINELFLGYWDFVKGYYRKNGGMTSEVWSIKRALVPLIELYGSQPGAAFGPLSLKTYRQRLIDLRLTRGVINKHVGRAKRFFRWAVENELIPPSVYHALQAVAGLRRGRSAAPESEPIKPVPDDVINVVLPHVNRYVAAMIQLQRVTGMRPGEVTIMRGRDLARTGKIWTYTPASHKTEHHGRERNIFLGPRAQEILRPFLLDDGEAYLFSPRRALEERREQVRQKSKAPLSADKRHRRRKRQPSKRPGDYYPVVSYEHVINRACDRAFPIPGGLSSQEAKEWRRDHRWSPNQLRHSAATFLRKEFGIEAARIILGHSSPTVTEVYAELDRSKAAEIMAKVG